MPIEEGVTVAVVGAGVMGTAAALAITDLGGRVTVFDQQPPGGRLGSSHGETRGIRLAYEDPAYAAWANDALRAWRALEQRCGESLVTLVGGLDAGPPQAPSFRATRQTLAALALDHTIMDRRAVNERWPGLELPVGWAGIYQRDAGLIAADRAVSAMRRLAETAGAEFRWQTPVIGVDGGLRPRLALADGRQPGFDAIVIAPGPWATSTLDLARHWRASRALQLLACEPLTVALAARAPAGMPLYFVHPDDRWSDGVYVQAQAPGRASPARIKVGRHGGRTIARPGEVSPGERVENYRELVARAALVMPALQAWQEIDGELCHYTMSPDERFLIEAIPGLGERVIGAAGFSGHGFKFAPVVGERIAALVAAALDRAV